MGTGVVVAVDAGTTGVRAMAVDDAGRPVLLAYRELTQHFPRPGWVEHDPDEIVAAVDAVLAEVTTGIEGRPVAAVGLTNQRETVVAWDRRTGRSRHRAVVWQDRRTTAHCARLAHAGHLATVRSATGLVLDPCFSATKLAWLLGEGGVAAGPDLAVGTVDSWVLWHLTGGAVHATDPSNASRTLLFDIHRGAWSDELCALFGVPARSLPEVRPSSGRLGVVADGPLAGVPVSGIAGDQQAALFGQACLEPGMAKVTHGTGSFVLMNIGHHVPEPADGLLTTVAWQLDGGSLTYALEGAVFATGATVQWLRDGLGIIATAAEVDGLAASVPDSEGVHLVPAFAGLGSPWWDPSARGAVVGLTAGSGRGQVARAALDAIAHQTRDVVESMASGAGRPVTVLRADGGAATDLVLQLQADQLQLPVARPVVAQTTALGAAFLAGLAEGVWGSAAEVAGLWATDVEMLPRVSRAAADARQAAWHRAVDRARGWAPVPAPG